MKTIPRSVAPTSARIGMLGASFTVQSTVTMSGQRVSPAFRARADEMIETANRQAREVPTGQVSASLMYATARFNAFHVAACAADADDMAAERDNAVEYFTRQYRKMFEDHFDECLANYERYTGGRTDSD